MKKSVFAIAACMMLLLMAFPLASEAAPLKKLSWRAEYYDNASLSGQPRIVRFEDNLANGLAHDWGYKSPSPEIPVDRFSARWTRRLHFDKGDYMFFLTVDDGARVWIDGKLIFDAWNVGHKSNLKTRLRFEQAGDKTVQIAYFENTGQASIHFVWEQLAGEDDIVGAWQGAYYNNRNLEGEPDLIRWDAAINFDWNSGSPSPRIARDNFSVRWTRQLYLPTGHYTFRVQHDDGMRFYIDDKIVYDSWYDQPVTYKVGITPIKGGLRTFTVEYYEHVGNAVVHFSFDEDPGDYEDYIPDPDDPAIYVDNKDPGFMWMGPEPFEERGGLGGSFYWTHNKCTGTASAGKWKPTLSEDGNYEVLVYVPAYQSSTSNARYHIQHYGRVKERTISQAKYSGEFVSLGIYYFDGSGNEFVKLTNCTNEPNGSTQVAFDAVKFQKR